MNYRYIGLVLLVGGLQADSRMVNQARADHGLRDSSARHFDEKLLGTAIIGQEGKRFQINVAPQCTGKVGLEGTLQGSSCGYHSVKNGLLAGIALLDGSSQSAYVDSMQSVGYAQDLFGVPQSLWRQTIIAKRNKRLANKIYRRKIRQALNNEISVTDNKLITQCINDLMVVEPMVSIEGFSYLADTSIVETQLRERIQKRIDQRSKASDDYYRLMQQVDQFFKPFEIDFVIGFDGSCYDRYNPTKSLGRASGDKYGAWLDADELMVLVEQQRAEGFLQSHPRLLVATYGENLGGAQEHAVASESLSRLYALMTETTDDVVATVLVYLESAPKKTQNLYEKIKGWLSSFGSQAKALQQAQDRGHWITCVVARLQGVTKYYVFDSVNSTRALACDRVKELEALLDGKKELPGYQWTVRQLALAQGALDDTKEPTISTSTKIALGATALAALACYGYYWWNNQPTLPRPKFKRNLLCD